MPVQFDPNKRPEENIAAFLDYAKQQDQVLGELLESKLSRGLPLSSQERADLAQTAIQFLRTRESETNG